MTHPSTIAFIGGGNMARCVLGGLVAGLTGKPVVARETHCLALGHEYCRIDITADN